MESAKMNQVCLSGPGMQELLLWLLFHSVLKTFGKETGSTGATGSTGTGGTVRLVRCLLCKHDDLTLDLQHLCEICAW